jgi:hypothetical protein
MLFGVVASVPVYYEPVNYEIVVAPAEIPIVGASVAIGATHTTLTITPAALPVVGAAIELEFDSLLTIAPAAIPITGAVVNPVYSTNDPALFALASQSSGTTVGTTATLIQFQTETHDSAAVFDTGASATRLTVPVGLNGRYGRVTGNVLLSSAAAELSVELLLNGARSNALLPFADAHTAGANAANPKGPPLPLATSDYYEMKATIGSGSVATTTANTWLGMEVLAEPFSGALVSNSTTQTLSDSLVVMTWDTESYDVGDWHAGGAPTRLTVPSGVSKVRLTAFGNFPVTGTNAGEVDIIKNGTTFRGMARANCYSTGNEGISVATAVVDVTPGDYFEYRARGTINAELLQTDSFFAIEAVESTRKGALVFRNSTQSITSGAFRTLNWNDEVYDTDGFHDNVTNPSRLTVPSGVSKVRLSANVGDGTAQWVCTLNKNGAAFTGSPFQDVEAQALAEAVNVMSAVVDVTPGDYFECTIFCTGNETITTADYTWFAIEVLE